MIEGTDLYEYFLCPYKVYNRHNRDRSLMIAPSDFSRRMMDNGREHEKEVVSHMDTVQPKYQRGDFDTGFEETLKLMKQGVPLIYQGVLKDGKYMGIPDLLIKEEGESVFGNWLYVVADVKIAERSKEQHIMQIMFYDFLLEKIQKSSKHKGVLYLKSAIEGIEFETYKQTFEDALKKVEHLTEGAEFGMHIDAVCKECPWKNVCVPLAEKTHDASLIYGLSRPVHRALNEIGIKSYDDVANANETQLLEINGIGETTVKKWKEQANVLITQKDKIIPLQLPDVENHICLDIETSEDGLTYLIGLWHNDKFVHFFTEDDEKKITEQFVDYLLSLGSYKLYHYGNIEKMVFRTMFQKYGIDESIAKNILNNMIDLFTLVKRHAILPLAFYNLKDVAKHFGFKWHASDASGGNSMVWFDEWKRTKDSELLKKILQYNEDDVHGTDVILKRLSHE
ncbi:MAG TPA: TM0106 family RecB-like putative nuclease [Candidatus Nanoarchaeia archaeon]|nr:TM0106 family RecB-like putative nuclease [Candidatus Nanoarchaeia archaeon]